MSENPISYLHRVNDRYELVYEERNLRITAPYVEWVFKAAADIISKIEKPKLRAISTRWN